jgi:hypothetical protein
MHYGQIGKPNTANRLFEHLRDRLGVWQSGWDLAMAVRTNALGTRISEVRQQLDPTQYKLERRVGEKNAQFYRLTRVTL